MKIDLKVPRFKQPYMECGPTALKQVLAYYGIDADVKQLVKECSSKTKCWDWDFNLGVSALKRGFRVTIYTMSLFLFDPTWYELPKKNLIKKLQARLEFFQRKDIKRKLKGEIYLGMLPFVITGLRNAIKFLKIGGEIRFQPITRELLIRYLKKRIPIITPIEGTLIFKRKRALKGKWDDVRGRSEGHIVVVSGYKNSKFILTDPGIWTERTNGKSLVDCDLLINGILLNDGDIIVVYK